MLKRMTALAATAAMLGANAAAYAIIGARAVVRNVIGASGGEADNVEAARGTKVQPSIPPMPPTSQRKEPGRKAAPHKVGTHKAAAAKSQRGKSTHRKVQAQSRARRDS